MVEIYVNWKRMVQLLQIVDYLMAMRLYLSYYTQIFLYLMEGFKTFFCIKLHLNSVYCSKIRYLETMDVPKIMNADYAIIELISISMQRLIKFEIVKKAFF